MSESTPQYTIWDGKQVIIFIDEFLLLSSFDIVILKQLSLPTPLPTTSNIIITHDHHHNNDDDDDDNHCHRLLHRLLRHHHQDNVNRLHRK